MRLFHCQNFSIYVSSTTTLKLTIRFCVANLIYSIFPSIGKFLRYENDRQFSERATDVSFKTFDHKKIGKGKRPAILAVMILI